LPLIFSYKVRPCSESSFGLTEIVQQAGKRCRNYTPAVAGMRNEIFVEFKKATQHSQMNRGDMAFEPQNKLEEALMQAASTPSAKPRFLKTLLESEIYIVQNDPIIENDDIRYRPMYSSPIRSKSETNAVSVRAKEFLESARGTDFILNPGSTYGRTFSADEVADLLDGGIWLPKDEEVKERESQIMLGQPANYPTELVETLKRFFQRRDEVKRAWLGHIYDPLSDENAHSLVAIEVDDNWDEISSQTGTVASAVKIPDPPVDILQISGNGGIEDYFLNDVEPFYIR
jgi:hypothetical protein